MTMKKNLLLLAGVTSLMFASCTTNNDSEPSSNNPTPGPVDVYVAGMKYPDVATEKNKAVYWKNNTPIYLTDGTRRAGAEKIRVVGNDVYVLGTENNAQDRRRYKIWKNGTSIPFLSNELCTVFDFWVDGNDVYAVGINENTQVAYWKNGIQTILTNNDETNDVGAIKVVNGDVYIAGYNIESGGLTYWKNGVTHPMESSTNSAILPFIDGIEVVGNDVYVIGNYPSYSNGNTPGAPQYGVYWKNGDLNVLGVNVFTKGISVSNNDVYISGSDDSGACYFKNGERFALSNGVVATEIKVLNGNLYVSGTLSNPKTGLLWINGVQSSYQNAEAKDLFVVQN
jgi:hypothetical protein